MPNELKVRFDKETKKWFSTQPPWQETTLTQCTICGLHYKPCLGHKCEKESKR